MQRRFRRHLGDRWIAADDRFACLARPPEIAGVKLALQKINDAGGVLGKDVKFLPVTPATPDFDTAQLTVDKHLQQGVDAIVGPASSSVALTVIDTVTGAGIVMFSPANTSPDLTTATDGGLYFRTAPVRRAAGSGARQPGDQDGLQSVAHRVVATRTVRVSRIHHEHRVPSGGEIVQTAISTTRVRRASTHR